MKDCKHEYKLSHTQWEYPHFGSSSATVSITEKEVAYMVCNKCLSVKKVLVEQVVSPKPMQESEKND